MELQIGVAKINKYATSESGDTLEFIERPGGGISVVLADGQMSGKSAKAISNKVVSKVVSLLSDGVRDGAAARAASDYLYHEKKGRVQATLNILSADLVTKTIVISRNNPSPVYVIQGQTIEVHNEASQPVGIYRDTRPVITQVPLETGLILLVFSDGITNAGARTGKTFNITATVEKLLIQEGLSAQQMADIIIQAALELDDYRPMDDVSIVVVRVVEHTGDKIRRASITLPIA